MRIQLPFAVLFAAIFACSMHAAPAQAQRVFVSATGSDGNPCTFASPCRSFQHAHDIAAANSEIDVLDPGGYGVLTINKAISIQGHGFAGITAPSGNAITIGAGATDRITLRGLLLDGSGTGNNGLEIDTAGSVDVDECVLRNFFMGIGDFSGGSSLFASNSLITHMSFSGIFVSGGGSATTRATISRVEVNDSVDGIRAEADFVNNFTSGGTVLVNVSDSTVAGSSDVGVVSINNSTPAVVAVLVTRSSIVAGGIGVETQGANTFLRVNQSTIAHNSGGWLSFGGTLTSWGNNAFNDIFGGDDTAPPTTPLK
jgi:hypothetical protein